LFIDAIRGGLSVLDKIRRLFSGESKRENLVGNAPHSFEKSQDEVFHSWLEQSKCFKEDQYEVVLRHLNSEIDLNKLGTKLTVEQKRELGFNTRVAITDALVNVLSEKGLAVSNPKDELAKIYYRGTFEYRRLEDIQELIRLDVEEVTYQVAGDERDCIWCKANNGLKFRVSDEINEIIKTNCTCDWNRSFLAAVINFD
jgi:hypothetical protein